MKPLPQETSEEPESPAMQIERRAALRLAIFSVIVGGFFTWAAFNLDTLEDWLHGLFGR